MKPSFLHRLVNGPFEDPCAYVRFMHERRAMLFDAGDVRRLSQADLMKLTDVFVTHTHMDHFIGFDVILRSLLIREAPLRVYGPAGMADSVEGKLRGYSWNLIKEYSFKLDVCTVENNKTKWSLFYAENGFERIDRENVDINDHVILQGPSFKVRAAELRHGIPSLGFSLEEDYHININKAALTDMGFEVGPWLFELKKAIRDNMPDDHEIIISSSSRKLAELRALAMIGRGQKISYVADSSPDGENIARIISLVRDSDTLYCETYFIDEDMPRAVDRNHLTGKIAAGIAKEADVKTLVPMHFSPKYRNSDYNPGMEALSAFKGTLIDAGRFDKPDLSNDIM